MDKGQFDLAPATPRREGFERYHVQEKLQFLNIARASTGEVRSLLFVIEDNYPNNSPLVQELRTESIRVGQLISGLIRSTESRKQFFTVFKLRWGAGL